jgi:hypothetical protein
MKIFVLCFLLFGVCFSQTKIDRENEFKDAGVKQKITVDTKTDVLISKNRIVWNKYGDIVYYHETYNDDVSKTYPGLNTFFAEYSTEKEAKKAITDFNLKEREDIIPIEPDLTKFPRR